MKTYRKQGQLRKILIIVLLALLILVGIIVAQNPINESVNSSIENTNPQTNINTSLDDIATQPNDTTNTATNTTSNLCTGITCSISRITCQDGFTASCENSCISETGTCTECIPDCTGHEQNATQIENNETITQPEKNNTIPPGTGLVIGNETSPQIEIQLSYPSKITRGEIANIKAKITTLGSAKVKSVVANWILPQDFEIISGSLTENCGNLKSGESCISAINIQTLFSTPLGKNQIKIAVSYENE